jgi:type II secretory pathway pseudopilin PulG
MGLSETIVVIIISSLLTAIAGILAYFGRRILSEVEATKKLAQSLQEDRTEVLLKLKGIEENYRGVNKTVDTLRRDLQENITKTTFFKAQVDVLIQLLTNIYPSHNPNKAA